MFQWLNKRLAHWLMKDKPAPALPLCDFDRICYELRQGDVILIEGRSKAADIIRTITQTAWSHSALYLGRIHDIEDKDTRALIQKHYQGPPGTQLIIEGIMGEGIVINPLEIYKNDHIRLCRPKSLSPQDAQNVINHAVTYLGQGYDTRQVFDLFRLLLPWRILPKTWGSSLFKKDGGLSSKTMCSTMMAEAYDSVNYPILPIMDKKEDKTIELRAKNAKLITPRDFDYSPYFEIIKYPFIAFAEHAPYRNLPWKTQEEESDASEPESGPESESVEEESDPKVEIINTAPTSG